MNNRVRHSLFRAGLLSLLCMATLAEAAPRHALTLYDEKPKYPANFQHFEYVNPEAPKGGTLRQAGFGSLSTACWRKRSRKARTTAGCASTCARRLASTMASR